MGSSGLGLILGLGIDATQAEMDTGHFGETLSGLGRSSAQTSQQMGDAFAGVDKNLLSSRESARLLTEELGLHMPRAVTSAISELMPAIGGIGGALLAIFAVKEVVAFGHELHTVADEFDGVAAAEKRVHEIGKENLSLLEKEVKGNKESLMGELTRAQFRAVNDEAELNALKEKDKRQLAIFGPYAAGYMLVTHALGKLDEAQDKLTADQELAGKMAAILRDNNEKGARSAVEAAQNQDDAYQRLTKRDEEEEKAWYAWYFKAREEAGKQLGRDEKSNLAAAASVVFLDKQLRDEVDLVRAVNAEMMHNEQHWKSAAPAIIVQANATKHLTDVQKAHIGIMQGLTHAQGEANAGLAQSAAYVAQNAASILETLGLKREYAGVMAIYEMAEGYAALGSYDFWGAAQDFASAGMYAKMAGTGSGGHGGGEGGGGGSQPSYGRGGGGSGSSGGGGAATPGGGGGGGTTVHLHLEGPGWTQEHVLQLMAQMSGLAKGGQGYLTASNALTNAEKLT